MKRLLLPIIFLSLFILSACGAAGPDASTGATTTLHEMTFTATAEGWEARSGAGRLDANHIEQ